VTVQRVQEGWLEYELTKVEQCREPPVPVWAWLSLDSREWAGELYGWAANPNGADDGWRGLVRAEHTRLRVGAVDGPRAGARLTARSPATRRERHPANST
jgi:hypothetical protein